MSRSIRAAARTGLVLGLAAAVLLPVTASADTPATTPKATTPATTPAVTTVPVAPATTVAGLLAPYATAFDRDNNNFNVAAHLVLQYPQLVKAAASPGDLTVFLPTDYAVRRLVREVTGKTVVNEQKLLEAVMRLPGLRFDQLIKYHVVKGARLTYSMARKANGTSVTTVLGVPFKVAAPAGSNRVTLHDLAPKRRDPRVVRADWQATNGVVHVIDAVLLPVAI
jgi:uncharacterized surface protein with fasciclin (FAS1) repeats